jgi:hypothetical protein
MEVVIFMYSVSKTCCRQDGPFCMNHQINIWSAQIITCLVLDEHNIFHCFCCLIGILVELQ